MITLKINIDRLRHNIDVIKKVIRTDICAVVKADAYGHGSVLARFMEDKVEAFAVANESEALSLSCMGIRKPIYILCPSLNTRYIRVISSADELVSGIVSIKINTGMNRLGANPEDVVKLIEICAKKKIQIDSLCTHFSDADDKEFTRKQFEIFSSVGNGYKKHCAASNCLKLPHEYSMDMVRVGLGLYGYGDERLLPVMSAFSSVLEVRNVKKGEHIGYGKTIADKNMCIAVIFAGYADGMRRMSRTVFINGTKYKTIGNICMDMMFAEIDSGKVKKGDAVELLGDSITADQTADELSTIEYEILTTIGGLRARRIYE